MAVKADVLLRLIPMSKQWFFRSGTFQSNITGKCHNCFPTAWISKEKPPSLCLMPCSVMRGYYALEISGEIAKGHT